MHTTTTALTRLVALQRRLRVEIVTARHAGDRAREARARAALIAVHDRTIDAALATR